MSIPAGSKGLEQQVKDQIRALLPSLPGSSFEWFNRDNRTQVRECLIALIQAILTNQSSLIGFYAGAVASVYHHDRADRACALVPEKLKPIVEMPQEIIEKREYPLSDIRYQLNLVKVTNWVKGIPSERVNLIAKVGQEAPPDAFYLATCKEHTRLYPDPILYAKYGDWYVKVAEWE